MNVLISRSICFSIFCGLLAATASAADRGEFFEQKIRPVLVKHCYECHSQQADVVQGDLRLDHRQAMIRGGDSGAAIVPGKPAESLLVAALRYDGLEMPPDGRLDDRVIADFEAWVRGGAIDPRVDEPAEEITTTRAIDWRQAKSFWAFQPPTRHPAPETKNSQWVSAKLDAFVLARLESAGLRPNPPADRRALIRRVTFDLTGLPPTPQEVDDFVNDAKPGALRRVVDRLLGSPQHSERWTRMWLDVARYAEDQAHIVGNNDSLTYPNAYLYRDWVIESLAKDLPYDEFIRLQLAADLLDAGDTQSHLALGFLGLGPKYYRRNSPEVMADEWEDRVDAVSRGLLGLTVACARCHDHKYDPIPTEDYYSLAGVFASTQMFNRPLSDQVEAKGGEAKKPQDAAHIVRDGKPVDLNVMIRGDVNKKGPLAPRSFLRALSSGDAPKFDDGSSGRGDLADAIVDRSNPLTARVIVNRVWRELMGRGLVETPSNFGQLGERPSHPQLLDDLAVRFMDNGWSLKWLQREIVLSSTYRQSSQIDSEAAKIDPDNRLRWRMPRRRLSVEAYRDAILSVSDRLQRSIGGRSMEPNDAAARRRTVYAKISRLNLNPMLARFDFPDPNAHSAKRVETTTPLQKLFLLNSPFLVEQADALAERLDDLGGSYPSKIQAAYRLLYSREPTDDEIRWAEEYIGEGRAESWPQYVQALLISNEMFTID